MSYQRVFRGVFFSNNLPRGYIPMEHTLNPKVYGFNLILFVKYSIFANNEYSNVGGACVKSQSNLKT
jgi:hypothetical protein